MNFADDFAQPPDGGEAPVLKMVLVELQAKMPLDGRNQLDNFQGIHESLNEEITGMPVLIGIAGNVGFSGKPFSQPFCFGSHEITFDRVFIECFRGGGFRAWRKTIFPSPKQRASERQT